MAVLAWPSRLKQASLRDVPGLRPPAYQLRGAGGWPRAVLSGVGLPLNNNNNNYLSKIGWSAKAIPKTW